MGRNNFRYIVRSALFGVLGQLDGLPPGEEITERETEGTRVAELRVFDLAAGGNRAPSAPAGRAAGPPPDDDGEDDADDAATAGRINRCAVEILVHLRTSDRRCWSDIVDAVTRGGHGERTVGRWIRWLDAHGWIKNAGKNSPYHVISQD